MDQRNLPGIKSGPWMKFLKNAENFVLDAENSPQNFYILTMLNGIFHNFFSTLHVIIL
ncbi:hypothetical protein HOLleu_12237 [Holothuria leucospilota]|uniref:Uncharacterized protein n=1 Tax=Holothuria leucospilota TaxID=206669 RepID=A0A9Q1C9V0_HOLLE|nr:hypothetical protein HOLleu_12237 [Holothuria leucospilota]